MYMYWLILLNIICHFIGHGSWNSLSQALLYLTQFLLPVFLWGIQSAIIILEVCKSTSWCFFPFSVKSVCFILNIHWCLFCCDAGAAPSCFIINCLSEKPRLDKVSPLIRDCPVCCSRRHDGFYTSSSNYTTSKTVRPSTII